MLSRTVVQRLFMVNIRKTDWNKALRRAVKTKTLLSSCVWSSGWMQTFVDCCGLRVEINIDRFSPQKVFIILITLLRYNLINLTDWKNFISSWCWRYRCWRWFYANNEYLLSKIDLLQSVVQCPQVIADWMVRHLHHSSVNLQVFIFSSAWHAVPQLQWVLQIYCGVYLLNLYGD